MPDNNDNCPTLSNLDQSDYNDDDGIGDVCDIEDNSVIESKQPVAEGRGNMGQ